MPVKRVYRQLYNTNLYLSAYGRIYRNAGSMTPGITDKTADGTSLETFDTIIAALKQERYQWQPARRTYIPKKTGKKKRPLGMPVWSDKLLAEVMRMILDAYFDETFSEYQCLFISLQMNKQRPSLIQGRCILSIQYQCLIICLQCFLITV